MTIVSTGGAVLVTSDSVPATGTVIQNGIAHRASDGAMYVVNGPALSIATDTASVTANTAAIQAALDAANAAGGGQVVLSATGTAQINATLVIGANTELELASGTTIQLAPSSNCMMLQNYLFNSAAVAISSLTTADGITVTATVASAGALPAVGDAIAILGAAQKAYNGGVVVASVNTGGLTFTYKLTADDAPTTAVTTPATGTLSYQKLDQNIRVKGGTWDYNGASQTTPDTYQKFAIFLMGVYGGYIRDTTIINATKYAIAVQGAYNHYTRNIIFRTNSDGAHYMGHGMAITMDGLSGYTGDDLAVVGNSDYAQYIPSNMTVGDFDGVTAQNLKPKGSLSAFKYFGATAGEMRNLSVSKVSGRISGGQGFVNFTNDTGAVNGTASTLKGLFLDEINWDQGEVVPCINFAGAITVTGCDVGKINHIPGNNNNANTIRITTLATVDGITAESVRCVAPSYLASSISIYNAGTLGYFQCANLFAKNVGIAVYHTGTGTSTDVSNFETINCGQAYKSAANGHKLNVGYISRVGYQSSPHVEFTTGGCDVNILSGIGLYSTAAFGGAATSKSLHNFMGIGVDVGGTGIARQAGAMGVHVTATPRGTLLTGNVVVCDATGAALSWKQVSNTTLSY